MKRITCLFCLLLFLILSFACQNVPTSSFQDAKVIMKFGPIYSIGQYAFFDTGRANIYLEGLVQNKGLAMARNVRITVWLYNLDSKLLERGWVVINPPDLQSQQIASWQVIILDSHNDLKPNVDKSKINYEITWE